MQHVEAPARIRMRQMKLAAAATVRPDPLRPYVYFIRMGDKGPIKIGFALNPYYRLGELQTASPYKLRLLAAFVGGAEDEGRLHGFFARERLEGEWFRPSKRLLKLIGAHGLPTEAEIRDGQTARWYRAARQNRDLARIVNAASSERHSAKPLMCRRERWDQVYGPMLAEASARTPEHFDMARDVVFSVLPPCRPVCRCNEKEG